MPIPELAPSTRTVCPGRTPANPAALDLIRERALPALAEMARWKTLRYALPSFLLLGRTAGIPDQELQDQWQKGDRETAIRKATTPAPKPKTTR